MRRPRLGPYMPSPKRPYIRPHRARCGGCNCLFHSSLLYRSTDPRRCLPRFSKKRPSKYPPRSPVSTMTSPAPRPQAVHHAAHAAVDAYAKQYASQAAALFQTYVDLRYAAAWRSLRVCDVVRHPSGEAAQFGGRGWALICGTAPHTENAQAVLPMNIEQSFDTAMYVFRLIAGSPRCLRICHRTLRTTTSCWP